MFNNGIYTVYNTAGDIYSENVNWPGDKEGFKVTSEGDFILFTWFEYNQSEDTWSLEETDLYKLTSDSILYYGSYDYDKNLPIVFDKAMKIPRFVELGESFNFKLSLKISGNTLTSNEFFGIGEEVITFRGIPECIILKYASITNEGIECSQEAACPGYGVVSEINSEPKFDDADNGEAEIVHMNFQDNSCPQVSGTPATVSDFGTLPSEVSEPIQNSKNSVVVIPIN